MEKFFHISKIFLTFILCSFILCIGYYFSVNYFYLNTDVGWHLQVARLISQGKVLYKDINEVNFPLIYYSKLIPLYFSKKFGTEIIFTNNIFNYVLCCISFFLTAYIIIKSKTLNFIEKLFFTVCCCYSLFILPFALMSNQIGQKEHYFIIFFLPYFFSYFYDVKGKLLPVITGVLASFAFVVKPFFIIFFITAELIRYLNNREIASFKRLDVYACTVCLVLFAAIFVIFFNGYFTNSLQIIKYTYAGHMLPRTEIFEDILVRQVATIIIIISYLNLKPDIRKTLYFLGFYICGLAMALIQNESLATVRLPLYCAELMIGALCLAGSLKFVKDKENLNDVKSALIVALFFSSFIANHIVSIKRNYQNDKKYVRPEYSIIENMLKETKGNNTIILSRALNYSHPTIYLAGKESNFNWNSVWVPRAISKLFKSKKLTEKEFLLGQHLIEKMMHDIKVSVAENNPESIVFINFRFYKKASKEKTDFLSFFKNNDETKDILSDYKLKKTAKAKIGKIYLYVKRAQLPVAQNR